MKRNADAKKKAAGQRITAGDSSQEEAAKKKKPSAKADLRNIFNSAGAPAESAPAAASDNEDYDESEGDVGDGFNFELPKAADSSSAKLVVPPGWVRRARRTRETRLMRPPRASPAAGRAAPCAELAPPAHAQGVEKKGASHRVYLGPKGEKATSANQAWAAFEAAKPKQPGAGAGKAVGKAVGKAGGKAAGKNAMKGGDSFKFSTGGDSSDEEPGPSEPKKGTLFDSWRMKPREEMAAKSAAAKPSAAKPAAGKAPVKAGAASKAPSGKGGSGGKAAGSKDAAGADSSDTDFDGGQGKDPLAQLLETNRQREEERRAAAEVIAGQVEVMMDTGMRVNPALKKMYCGKGAG